MKKNEKAVILLSGGLDSTVTLYYAKKDGYKLFALIFDYNQRHKKEIEAAKKIAKINKIKYYLLKINLDWSKSSLIDKSINIPLNKTLKKSTIPNTYVSARNIIFLSYAFSLAESIGAKKIFIGAHIQDYSGYPDCRPNFFKAFEHAANLGMKQSNIKIKTPLINKSKIQIVKLGIKLSVPFQFTWSCYMGKSKPCKKCDSCRFRIKAFSDLGMVDPLIS
ncbi:MAG: 7-cyano-7-deazaguanine synthase QueC [Candidatus Omnitrophica bacterium]|nr:7-cyano-7-deazaguanine synthase QueC [Candidatus Omnitrophota bacterium]